MRWFDWNIQIEHDQMIGEDAAEASAIVGHHVYWVFLRREISPNNDQPWTIEVEQWPLSWDEELVSDPATTIHTEEISADQGYARFAEILEHFDTILMAANL